MLALCNLCDRQIAVGKIGADVSHDRPEPCGGDTASFSDRSAAGCGRDGRSHEIMHVADRESLQLGRGERQVIGNGTGVGDKQAQCFRAMRDQAHWHIVEPANECCDRLTRHSTAKEAGGRRPHKEQAGLTSRRNDGITVPEQLLPITLESHAATPYIDADQEIVRTIRDRLAGPYAVAQTGEGSDEWLAGYPWYKTHRLLSLLDIIPGVSLRPR